MVRAYLPQNAPRNLNSNTNNPPQGRDLGTGVIPEAFIRMLFEDGNTMQYEDNNIMIYEGIPSNWFDENFKSRVPIKVVPSKVQGSHTNYKFLFNQVFPDFENRIQSAGQDIRFVNVDGDVIFPIEIEFVDEPTQTLISDTTIPILDSTTEWFMYYDNPNASALNPEDVWDPQKYRGVWHMNDPSFGPGSILDSTSNNNDGDTAGSPTSVNGQIGKAYRTNTGGFVTIPSSTSIDAIGSTSFTLSCWTENFNSLDQHYGLLEKKVSFNDTKKGFQWWNDFRAEVSGLTTRMNDGTHLNDQVMDDGGAARTVLQNTGINYIVFTYDAVTKQAIQYIDAVQGQVNIFTAGSGFTFNNTEPLTFGKTFEVTAIDAIFDEIRVQHNVVQSPALIATEFNNQSQPSAFITIGDPQRIP